MPVGLVTPSLVLDNVSECGAFNKGVLVFKLGVSSKLSKDCVGFGENVREVLGQFVVGNSGDYIRLKLGRRTDIVASSPPGVGGTEKSGDG